MGTRTTAAHPTFVTSGLSRMLGASDPSGATMAADRIGADTATGVAPPGDSKDRRAGTTAARPPETPHPCGTARPIAGPRTTRTPLTLLAPSALTPRPTKPALGEQPLAP